MKETTSKKIIIDQRKFRWACRLGLTPEILWELVSSGKVMSVQDTELKEIIDSMYTLKEFDNRGGNHNPTGRNQWSKGGQKLDKTVVKTQNTDWSKNGLIGDRDIDIDKDIDSDYDKDKDNINNNKYYGVQDNAEDYDDLPF